jgi:transposase
MAAAGQSRWPPLGRAGGRRWADSLTAGGQFYLSLDAMKERASAPMLTPRPLAGPVETSDQKEAQAMVYIGVDLHRNLSHVVALDQAGEVVLERRFGNSRTEFQRVFGELEPEPIEVAFEATYGWSWFAELLADAGIAAHMAHPLATKAISAGRVKNDAVDARTLAHLLRANLLPEAWIAPPEIREARRLVRMRVSLVRMRSRLKAQVHALCADAGVPVPVSDLFGRRGRELLGEVTLRPVSAGRLAASLRLIDDVGREIVAADRELVGLYRGDDRIRRVTPIPGIGFLTATTIIAEVGDIGRFSSPEQLTSWAGLTPTERSSADHTRRGHISKQGSRWLRWAMVEAAARVGRAPELHRLADPIAARRGVKIARVALARRLLTLAFYALRDPDGCQAYPPLHRSSRPVQARSRSVMASA